MQKFPTIREQLLTIFDRHPGPYTLQELQLLVLCHPDRLGSVLRELRASGVVVNGLRPMPVWRKVQTWEKPDE